MARPPPLLIQPLAIQPNASLPSAARARRPWLAASDSPERTRATIAVSPLVIERLMQQRARVRVERATSSLRAVYGTVAAAQRAAGERGAGVGAGVAGGGGARVAGGGNVG